MTEQLGPPLDWPDQTPAYGGVVLRAFEDRDVPMVRDLATDPYLPDIGSLTRDADEAEAHAYVERNRGRHLEGRGWSFCIADARTDEALGVAGLWVRDLAEGRATAGYSVAPRSRGRGRAAEALTALTTYAWTVPGLYRVSLFIEPWNVASLRTAERAGYRHEGLLRSWMEIGDRRADVEVYGAVRADA